MKHVFSIVGLLVVSAAALSFASAEPAPTVVQQAPPSYSVHVALDGQSAWVNSLQAEELVEVRRVVGSDLSVYPGADLNEQLGHALESTFPRKVSLSLPGPSYKSIWCPDEQEWKIVCCRLANYLVKFDDGMVRVEVHIEQRLDP